MKNRTFLKTRFTAGAICLALAATLTTTPSIQALPEEIEDLVNIGSYDDLPERPDEASPSPPVCLVSGCSTFSAAGDRTCSSWQMYEIDAKIDSGSGTATVEVRCGDSAVKCTVSTSGAPACHAEFAKGPGEFVCHVIEQSGTIKVIGSCKDPANPEVVYPLLPLGVGEELPET